MTNYSDIHWVCEFFTTLGHSPRTVSVLGECLNFGEMI